MSRTYNDITNCLFNAIDIKETIRSNGLNNIKRVHGGTDNEYTLKDLIDDIIYFLENLDDEWVNMEKYKNE